MHEDLHGVNHHYQDLACCPPGDISVECTPSKRNICSPSFNDPIIKENHNWYTYCAGMSDLTCGGK